MTICERHLLDKEVWDLVHCYTPKLVLLCEVCDAIVRKMKTEGHDAELVGSEEEDSQIVRIDDLKYKVLHNRGWGFFDVVMV